MNNFNNYIVVKKCDYCGHYHDSNMECPLKKENKICVKVLAMATALAIITLMVF